MKFINIKHPGQVVSFSEAVNLGLGIGQGLFFPESIPRLPDPDSIFEMPFVERSARILKAFVGDEIDVSTIQGFVQRAFSFPFKAVKATSEFHAIELFHGPSLAFKDFGARLLAEVLAHVSRESTTILTATSGDTGAAVANAFYQVPGIRVVVLYPAGRISVLQEKLFCTLGENITTLAVEADFDECQKLVKQSFEDPEIRATIGLNSANSINICRLLAQVCYYFEAFLHLGKPDNLVVSVPSGNFGNLTAGLIARQMGLPVKRFVAATNENDTVPRFMATGQWNPRPTQATMTNAMDISAPNNFPRIVHLCEMYGLSLGQVIESFSVSDADTEKAVRDLAESGYLAEPHTALAFAALTRGIRNGEKGVFLGTAHPAKFNNVVEKLAGRKLDLPDELARVVDLPLLSQPLRPVYAELKGLLLDRQ